MGIFDSLGDALGSVWHAVSGTMNEDDKRNARYAMQDQINLYRKQTELSESEIARKRSEEIVEKRRIEEKQIRALRRNFSPGGFLDSGSVGSGAPISDKLGA